MSIRTRNIHFTNWAKVIEALADKGVTVADESAARTFLTETSSDANPYYYYVGYIKDTQEIYTHGKFYSCSDSSYDDTELRNLIGTKADLSALEALVSEVEENELVTTKALYDLNDRKLDRSELDNIDLSNYVDVETYNSDLDSINASVTSKANQSDLEALSAEVEENEEVTAAALTELHENKADKSEIPDVSAFATTDELNTLSAEVDNKVDSATFTTLSETVAGHTTSITNLESNKADKTELEDYATTGDLNTKQDLLVSGTNIKTVNSNSILGSGNIETPDTKVTSAANHYGYNSNNATSTTGAFVTKITKDEANHVTSFESRALTATDIPSLDASKITSGTISIERLPAGALERMFVVESETAAMSATVQEGDVVQVTGNNNKMYFCISNTATTFATKFKEFTSGTATSVPWSGVTGKPDLATQEELDVVDAKFDNYQPKITSSNKLAYSLISGTPSIPTKLSQLTDDVVAGKYLSLTGGTVDGSITATSFIGNLTGNVTGNVSGSSGSCTGNAASATTVRINNAASNVLCPLIFVSNTTAGDKDLFVSTGKSLTFNPSTGDLKAPTFTGNLSGNATTATTATKVTVGTGSSNAYRAIVVTNGENGLYTAGTDTGKPRYNYSTGDVKAASFTTDGGNFVGNLTGTASGNLPLTGGTLTGDLELKAPTASGTTPKILFLRGTLDDTYQDWSIVNESGGLHFYCDYGEGVNDLLKLGKSTATLTGDLTISNNNSIKVKSSGGVEYSVLKMSTANSLYIGQESASNGRTTMIYGNVIMLRCGTDGTEALYIKADGNVAIGGTAADEKLHIYGNVKASGSMYAVDFETTSDNRLKDFVSDIHVDFKSLKQIPKKYYYWKDKSMGEDLQLGTSAQELAKIYPECVHYDETNDRYSVNYQKLSIVALAAIDKLHDRISELESKLYD